MRVDILATIDKTLAEAQLVCQRTGYSLSCVRILIALYREAPLRVTELAARANVTQQAVGKILRALEYEGLLKQTVDASDRRAILIDLTYKGTNTLTKIARVWK